MEKSIEDNYILKGGKKLRWGFTTGSCAAAAAKAAAVVLFTKCVPEIVRIMTPKGIMLDIAVRLIAKDEESVTCAVIKDAGDDPDVTDGIEIRATVSRRISDKSASDTTGIFIDGGEGVGRVTCPGLDQPVGNAAINHVPREMITKEVSSVCKEHQYQGGLSVVISVPEGESVAQKTFNPRLGIIGGISILGTSGIVMPMSEEALLETIYLDMRMQHKKGHSHLLITPGNYGQDYVLEHLGIDLEVCVKCSNYVGKTLDYAADHLPELKGILFVAHIGKFVKVAGGIMNTHSKEADCRMEILAAAVLRCGGDAPVAGEILSCMTTDAAMTVLEAHGLREAVMADVINNIEEALKRRTGGRIETGAIIFSNVHGFLGQTSNAGRLLESIREES